MAQTGKHTPGPWVAHYLPQHRMRVTAYDETPLACSICDIALWNVDYGEQQANASLIAAAPDMKAALLPLLEVVDEEIEQRKFSGNDEYWQGLQALSDAGHAAIAKAEGR